jgi:peptide/nickel transport system ATP-binding protein
MSDPLLEINQLSVSYEQRGVHLPVIRNFSLALAPGEAYGLVGESGCGKTTLAFTLMRFLPPNGRVEGGSVILDGEEVLQLEGRALRAWRGRKAVMVYQEPASALNPTMKIGVQVAETYRYALQFSRAEAEASAVEALARVALPNPTEIAHRYPHELSGGQQQRVVIAMALAANPCLLVLDEPTTGLDATVEAEVLDLVAELRNTIDAAILLISHNLGLLARMCDRVGVLYSGRLVEEGRARDVFDNPSHPYTHGLVHCVPRLGSTRRSAALIPIPGSLPPLGFTASGCSFAPRCPLARPSCRDAEPELRPTIGSQLARCFFSEEVGSLASAQAESSLESRAAPAGSLLEIKAAHKRFGTVVAVDDVDLEIREGEILGLVGESGSGKSTLARIVAGLATPDSGVLQLEGETLGKTVEARSPAQRRALQMVFQDTASTLNPRHTVRQVLKRAIVKLGGTSSVEELAAGVSLDPQRHLDVRSTTLSGGQKQRVAIGRAFAGDPSPKLVVCDEPVSSLDVSVQANVLNLLGRLADEEGVAYLFISHDLAVVNYLADRIAVMYLGQIVEEGTAGDVFVGPSHPYTEALVSAIPTLDFERPRERIRLSGTASSPGSIESGCRFHPRCPRKVGAICETDTPPWSDAGDGHRIRCHIPVADLRDLQRPLDTLSTSIRKENT